MNNYSQEIWELITRELSGEATPAEKKRLRQWLDDHPKHLEFYNTIKSSWQHEAGDSVHAPFLFDYESGLSRLRNKLEQYRSTPERRKKQLLLSRSSGIYSRVIAVGLVILVISLSVFLTLYFWHEPVFVTTYSTSNVEQRIITLQDGSVVRLNRNSSVEVHENGSANNARAELRLEGEAFFHVAENPHRSFIIYVDEAVVHVLGTSFNVKQGNEVMVAVQEGMVSFRHTDREEKSSARLVAGQLGLLSQDGYDIKVEDTTIENYMSWMNGYLRFESIPFDQVIRQLEHIYGFRHQLEDASIASYQLTVYTERMQMEEVLETIGLALDLAYEKQGDIITWYRE